MRLSRVLSILFILLVCGTAAAGPRIEHWTTPSGARVYFVQTSILPILDVQVDVAAGAARDPEGKSGLASLTHALLDLGAGDLDENQISTRLADLGALLSGAADKDRASVRLRTLSAAEKSGPALDILRAVLTRPQFREDVLERERARTLSSLKEALTRPDSIVAKEFWAALYPGHPYGRQASPETVSGLQRNDLAEFYRTNYSAQGASVTIVGDLARPEAEGLAQRLTDDLPPGLAVAPGEVPGAPGGLELRIPHPAAQAHVLIGLPALRRGDPDFFPLIVGNYTLGGGGFVSRLMKEVREKNGFAYSVYSSFLPMAQPGPFQIGLQTKKEQTGDALSVARRVLADFVANGPSEAELQAAKQNLVGSFPLRLDSNRKILDNVSLIGYYGLPLDYLDRYSANVEGVTVQEVRAAFARRVRMEDLVTVVVGSE